MHSVKVTRMTADPGYTYEGDELSLFASASNWKRYYARKLRPFIKGDVAEIGAGNGSTTDVLSEGSTGRWLAIEPDQVLLSQLQEKIATGSLPENVVPMHGNILSLGTAGLVDTILYIDVLEHIEDDLGEISRAQRYLRPGGHLIVLSPAYQSLYSPFDKSIGHYRRYTLKQLQHLDGPSLKRVSGFYLDAAGLLLSLANRLLLKQALPKLSQIVFWDTYVIRISRVLDPILGFRFGRSVISIWRKHPN
jgi:SAM-dependent methyltransferase